MSFDPLDTPFIRCTQCGLIASSSAACPGCGREEEFSDKNGVEGFTAQQAAEVLSRELLAAKRSGMMAPSGSTCSASRLTPTPVSAPTTRSAWPRS